MLIQPVIDGSRELGYPVDTMFGIGLVLFVATLLLVASMGDGLIRDGNTVAGTHGLDVTALAPDPHGLWVGTRHGLMQLAR